MKYWIIFAKALLLLSGCEGYNHSSLQELSTLEGKAQTIYTIAFSNDGKHLVAGGSKLPSFDDNLIEIWDTKTWKSTELSTKHRKKVSRLSFIPKNQNKLISADSGGEVYLWNLEKETITDVLKEGVSGQFHFVIDELAISPDGQFLVIGEDKKSLILRNLKTKTTQKLIPNKEKYWLSLSFSKDGNFLAIVSTNNVDLSSENQNSKIEVWDLKQKKVVRSIQRKGFSIAKFIPNNYDLVISNSGENSYIELWDVMSGKQKQTFLQKNKTRIKSLAFSPNGEILAWV